MGKIVISETMHVCLLITFIIKNYTKLITNYVQTFSKSKYFPVSSQLPYKSRDTCLAYIFVIAIL